MDIRSVKISLSYIFNWDKHFAPTGTECRVQWFWKEDVSLRWPESRTKSHVRSTWKSAFVTNQLHKHVDSFVLIIFYSTYNLL